MHTTTVFTARHCRFVVWTFPSSFGFHREDACHQVSTPSLTSSSELGSGLPPREASPNLTGNRIEVSLDAAQCEINSQASRFRGSRPVMLELSPLSLAS